MAEFRQFAVRGNVIDLAVAVVIGNAINKIVSSLVTDIFTPVIGIFIGRIEIGSLKFTIGSSLNHGSPLVIGYGDFLQSVLNFVTITFCIFVMLKMINKLRNFNFLKKEAEEAGDAPSEAPTTEELLAEIRDLLKAQAQQQKVLSDLPEHLDDKH